MVGCVNEHHYHPQETSYVPVQSAPKYAPAVQPQKHYSSQRSSGDFEAVERPSSYSR